MNKINNFSNLIIKNESILENNIFNLSNFIDKEIKLINEIVTIRNRKINFFSLFYFIIKYNINYDSMYSYNNISFCIDFSMTISTSAFTNKLILFNPLHLLNLNNNFLNFYYETFNLIDSVRYIAVDGSEIQLLASLNSFFKLNSNSNYTTGYISNLYDIDNNIPISFEIFASSNERNNLIKQLNYVKPNDVIIADRGYYSLELINKLLSLKINFVFRVKKNNIAKK